MKNSIFQKIVASLTILSLIFSCKTSSKKNAQEVNNQTLDSDSTKPYQNLDLIQQTNSIYYLDETTPLNLAETDQNDNSTAIAITSGALVTVAVAVGLGVWGARSFKEEPLPPKPSVEIPPKPVNPNEPVIIPAAPRTAAELERASAKGAAEAEPRSFHDGITVARASDGSVTFRIEGEKIAGDQVYVGKTPSPSRELKFAKIRSVDEIPFKPDDLSAFVVVSKDHLLLKSIPKDASVVRGLAEFRVLAADGEHVVLQATNLRPTFRATADIQAELTTGTSIPRMTFRQDPLFATKTQVLKDLQASSITVGGTGTLSGGTTFVVKKQLGKGSYGTVYLTEFTTRRGEKFKLAIKVQDLKAHEMGGLAKELQTLEGMGRHPDSTQYYGTVRVGAAGESTRFYTAMEALDGDWVGARDLDEALKPRLMISVADGYAALHAAGLGHFDTKAQNVLFSADGRSRLADYGFISRAKTGTLPKFQSYGTYVPPEVLLATDASKLANAADGRPYDPLSIDVFDVGFSMLELRLKGSVPLESIARKNGWLKSYQGRQVVDGVKLREYLKANPSLFRTVNTEELNLLFKMVDNDPWKRPTMADVAKELRRIHGDQGL